MLLASATALVAAEPVHREVFSEVWTTVRDSLYDPKLNGVDWNAGFHKYGYGKIVGTRTAGAVLAGKLVKLSDDSLMLFAAANVLVDGERLQGVGVAPDVEVPFDVRYAAGHDPQLERAAEILVEQLARPAR